MYKRVLVATGGSPWSDAAVAYAIRLAAGLEAELRIVTVLSVPVSYMTSEVEMVHDLMTDSLEQDAKARLARAAAHATWAGVTYETICTWGHIAETILQTADAEACDLIILGSRGVPGWKRLQLGSISNAVAAKARQPVLVVKHTTPPMPPVSAWRRLLVATGGSAWSDAAVAHAIRLAQLQQSELHLLHVVRGQSLRGEAYARSVGREILTAAAACAAAARVPCTTALATGNVVQAIMETATHGQCDGIILGSRSVPGWKRLMLGSTSNAVAAKAAQPVLIVKPGATGSETASTTGTGLPG